MSSFRRAYAGPGSEAKSGVRSGQIIGLLDEVDLRAHGDQVLGRRAGVITSPSPTMKEAVAIMSGAATLDGEHGHASSREGGESMIQDWA